MLAWSLLAGNIEVEAAENQGKHEAITGGGLT